MTPAQNLRGDILLKGSDRRDLVDRKLKPCTKDEDCSGNKVCVDKQCKKIPKQKSLKSDREKSAPSSKSATTKAATGE
eukprot:scaffold27070_cov147-Skeletonema_menzelii.AAC.9